MADLPWMPWYPGRWFGSEKVAGMTIAQEGAYRRLLDHAWGTSDCTIPNDREALKGLAKWHALPDEQFDKVLDCFQAVKKHPHRLFNQVQLNEWKKAQHNKAVTIAKGRKGGIKSGLSRGQAQLKPSLSTTQALILPNHTREKERSGGRLTPPVDKSGGTDRTTRGFESVGQGLINTIRDRVTKNQED